VELKWRNELARLPLQGWVLTIFAGWADEMLKRVYEEKKQSAQTAELIAGQKREEIEKINLRLQKLLDAFLDGVIERNDYTAEKAKLTSQ
jgi:hypothetical protein